MLLIFYDMVGVAVAMVIPTIHENHAQICTMHGNLKNIPKFGHSHISQPQRPNCGVITDTDLFQL